MRLPVIGTVISADEMNGRAVRLGPDRLTLLPRRRWRGRARCARSARWKLTYSRTLINDVRRCRQPVNDEK